jgi:hypothetical protein
MTGYIGTQAYLFSITAGSFGLRHWGGDEDQKEKGDCALHGSWCGDVIIYL